MRKLTILFIAISLTSCGATMRTLSGSTVKNLIKQVSIEQGCEVENIKLLEKQQASGNATYSLDVCGKRMVYKQIGSTFMESSKADVIVKKIESN